MGVEILNKSIKVSTDTKEKLDACKGTGSYNSIIKQMLVFFESTGYNPHRISGSPIAHIEKRIEDLVKIIRSQEKTYIRPIYDTILGDVVEHSSPRLVEMANTIVQLKNENEMLRNGKGDDNKAAFYRSKLSELVDLVNSYCSNNKFERSRLGSDLKIPENYFPMFLNKINEEFGSLIKD